LTRRLEEEGLDNISCEAGTAYKTTRNSVTVKDRPAYFEWLQETGEWQTADIRANAPAVVSFAEDNKGELPPGVNLSREIKTNIRAK